MWRIDFKEKCMPLPFLNWIYPLQKSEDPDQVASHRHPAGFGIVCFT